MVIQTASLSPSSPLFFAPALSSPECHYPKKSFIKKPSRGERHKQGSVYSHMVKLEHAHTQTVIRTCAFIRAARCRRGLRARRMLLGSALTHFRQGCWKRHAMSSSVQAELCAQFSMMRCPQWTDTTLLTVTPHYTMCTTSLLRKPLLRLSPTSDWLGQD